MRRTSIPALARWASTAALLALASFQVAAETQAHAAPDSTTLAPGAPVESEIRPGDRHVYRIELGKGDFLAASVQQKGIDLVVNVVGPDGRKLLEVDSPTGADGLEMLVFLARDSGGHTLEIRPLDAKRPVGRYEITLDEVLTPAQRIGYRDPLISPRLIALQQRLAGGDRAALESFWKEVAELGTPLVEPIEGDQDRVLVTFLWRAGSDTTNAYVMTDLERAMEAGRMTRMPQSDVYFKSYRIRNDARISYSFSIDDSEVPFRFVNWDDPREREKRSVTFRPDPLNPRRFPENPNAPDPYVVSIIELPKAPPQPWSVHRPDVPAGKLDRETFTSKILGNTRLVEVYTPAGYRTDGEPYDLLVLFGTRSYTVDVPSPVILDNLLAAKRIRPVVAVLIGAPSIEARMAELSCDSLFTDFLTTELLPWVRARYRIAADPRRTTLAGFSLGGLAGACAALRHPDIFGNVLSQSGSFWWQPADDPEPEWLTRQLASNPKLPVRFYVEVGLLENGPKNDYPSMLTVNRHLRDVLLAKGYDVIYREFSGDHHSASWRGTLADALQALLGAPQATEGR
jgi:enterochelin esterase-like enzyme